MNSIRKIINDPVYGFITIDHPLILEIISHPVYQRLRNIHQMAFAHLVYPGAVHSRLHHSLGAYHLMCIALNELKSKGITISEDEALGAKIAILLHDIGHGPFSHALEEELIQDVSHEEISLLLMNQINHEMQGELTTAIEIFTPVGLRSVGCGPYGLPEPRQFFYRRSRRCNWLRSYFKNVDRKR